MFTGDVEGDAAIGPAAIVGHCKTVAGGRRALSGSCGRGGLLGAEQVLELGAQRGDWLLQAMLARGLGTLKLLEAYNGRAIGVVLCGFVHGG